jgi:hypothetical protein
VKSTDGGIARLFPEAEISNSMRLQEEAGEGARRESRSKLCDGFKRRRTP